MEFKKDFTKGYSAGIESVLEFLKEVKGVEIPMNEYVTWTHRDTPKPIMKAKLICGKCNTEQIMIKRIIGKEFCWWCPNCKDQICNSAVHKRRENE